VFGIDPGPNWFGTTRFALPALMIISLWYVGNTTVIYLAGLQSVPQVLYEAATIDGAGLAARFRFVTLPMMTPSIFFTLVLGLIGAFQTFTPALVMTNGGPADATLFYLLHLYRNGFQYFKAEEAEGLARDRAAGRMAMGGLRHGHAFLLLQDLCGYAQLLYDMADGAPRLLRLIQMVEEFKRGIVEHYLRLGVEWMGYAEDLRMQRGPMLSPRQFRRYIKPSYERLMQPARAAGCIVHMHSDGDIRQLAADLIEGGVQVINLQDVVNGIDWIAAQFAGRVCIDLDIDRQYVTRFGTPAEVDALIRQEVETLGSAASGLMMIYGLYPGVPLENAAALIDAMTRYAGYFW
jgi:hypothetical protein